MIKVVGESDKNGSIKVLLLLGWYAKPERLTMRDALTPVDTFLEEALGRGATSITLRYKGLPFTQVPI